MKFFDSGKARRKEKNMEVGTKNKLMLDSGQEITRSSEEFRDTLSSVEAESKWLWIRGGTISVEGPDELSELPEEVFSETEKTSPYTLWGTFEDVLTGDKTTDGFMLRCSAVLDLFARASETSRSGISCLPDHREILTRIYRQQNQTFLALVRHGRLASLHSDVYAPISQVDVYSYIEDEFLGANGPTEGTFMEGEYTLFGSCSWYQITDKTLLQEYNDALDAAGIALHGKPYAGLRVSTSDVGTAAVRIAPYIQNGNLRIQLPGQGCVRHIGSADMDKVRAEAEKVFLRYTHGVKDLIRLMSIPLQNPYEAILAAGLKLRMPAKELTEYLTARDAAGALPEMTAYQAYEILNEIVSVVSGSITSERKFNLEESLYLALQYDWKTLDRMKGPKKP
jgi:hypothetical protein